MGTPQNHRVTSTSRVPELERQMTMRTIKIDELSSHLARARQEIQRLRERALVAEISARLPRLILPRPELPPLDGGGIPEAPPPLLAAVTGAETRRRRRWSSAGAAARRRHRDTVQSWPDDQRKAVSSVASEVL